MVLFWYPVYYYCSALAENFFFFHPLGRQMVLETLYALTSNTKLVKEAMAKGNT